MPEFNDDNAPVTRADLKGFGEELLVAITKIVETIVEAAIAASEARSQEFARDIETHLLTAFHGHAKAQTVRTHTQEISINDLQSRMSSSKTAC